MQACLSHLYIRVHEGGKHTALFLAPAREIGTALMMMCVNDLNILMHNEKKTFLWRCGLLVMCIKAVGVPSLAMAHVEHGHKVLQAPRLFALIHILVMKINEKRTGFWWYGRTYRLSPLQEKKDVVKDTWVMCKQPLWAYVPSLPLAHVEHGNKVLQAPCLFAFQLLEGRHPRPRGESTRLLQCTKTEEKRREERIVSDCNMTEEKRQLSGEVEVSIIYGRMVCRSMRDRRKARWIAMRQGD